MPSLEKDASEEWQFFGAAIKYFAQVLVQHVLRPKQMDEPIVIQNNRILFLIELESTNVYIDQNRDIGNVNWEDFLLSLRTILTWFEGIVDNQISPGTSAKEYLQRVSHTYGDPLCARLLRV